jgi:hypothetical protein
VGGVWSSSNDVTVDWCGCVGDHLSEELSLTSDLLIDRTEFLDQPPSPGHRLLEVPSHTFDVVLGPLNRGLHHGHVFLLLPREGQVGGSSSG